MDSLSQEFIDRLSALRDRAVSTSDTERRTESMLRVQLTDEERLRFGQELSDAHAQAQQLDADLSNIKKSMQAKIEGQEAIVDQKSECLRNGYEIRTVECVDVLDHPRRGRKTTFRLDTLQAVEEGLMTAGEMQRMLKLDEDRKAVETKGQREEEKQAPTTDAVVDVAEGLVNAAIKVGTEKPSKLPKMRKPDAVV